jgi:L-iduronidase
MSTSKPFARFWRSCGWCPDDPHPIFADYFLTEDMFQNHALISGVPHQGIQFVRIHYLLDLINLVSSSKGEPDDSVHWFDHLSPYLRGKGLNFTSLDLAMDQLVHLNISVGWEVMGNPGNLVDRSDRLFTDFSDASQIHAWGQMVQTIASRYIARFGAPVVRTWRWESWNEPDGQCGKNLTVGIKCELDTFLQYFEATAKALRATDEKLVFGGPASDGSKQFLIGLVKQCTGKNNSARQLVSADTCRRIDFLNAHLKGEEDAEAITRSELPVALWVQENTKGTVLEGVRWGNDEADPKVGWSHLYDWRGDARYAAMVPKAINQHQQLMIDGDTGHGIPYDVLSNDNGFLPYPYNDNHTFQQRTLVARWAFNHTSPAPTVEIVRKPVMSAMALLSLLGGRIHTTDLHVDAGASAARAMSAAAVAAEGAVAPVTDVMSSPVGVIATSNLGTSDVSTGGDISVLIYNSVDSGPIVNGAQTTVDLTLANVPMGAALGDSVDAVVALFMVDEVHANSHTVWRAQGSPDLPSPVQLAGMRAAAEVAVVDGYPKPLVISLAKPHSQGGNASLSLNVSLPGVALVHICFAPSSPSSSSPSKPSSLRLHRTRPPSRTAKGAAIPSQVMLKWDGVPEPCIKSYVVMHSSGGTAARVNPDTIYTSFLHALPEEEELVENAGHASKDCYTVSAIDYWGNAGMSSDQVCV